MDKETSVEELKELVKTFCEARDWDQFHDPKELAIGIVTESSELLDHFRFRSREQMESMLSDEKKRQEISEELADTLWFILRFSQMYNIDLSSELKKKMSKNDKKYPVDKVKGNNMKYHEF